MKIEEVIKEWNERCEQLYLEMASHFSAAEELGHFSLLYDPEKDTIKSLSESMLEWPAEARGRLRAYEEIRGSLVENGKGDTGKGE